MVSPKILKLKTSNNNDTLNDQVASVLDAHLSKRVVQDHKITLVDISLYYEIKDLRIAATPVVG